MSTLVTHHNGLDRIIRGIDIIVSGVVSGVAQAGNAASQRNAVGLSAPAQSKPSASLSSSFKARLALWQHQAAFRRERQELEALFRADPRLRSDFQAAKAWAESH
jgi:hypothetical protein